mmetsp:Transcript_831/g.1860  ORF Transcript_831/g.1860 Transcript_831/m.1860 type:complete len:108 (+) Transcript_831:1637-1960(+)|eukprot:CAMPEP_0204915950 /NCGR_PEP_ID=MMETSP1397-20131031/13861_1 /ASSEMBLY_ACC=CAM_ASM_000891 /TAXON_ID=49980 /ORGANISM="Climacostomum Climacostomum virens, Strain Stock W-24" /LENGTH=107 /DNA_ID=CAMNT_0052088231 /DNA_START=1527 /DNA_END=1850 /DNA_ORIENTATION=-
MDEQFKKTLQALASDLSLDNLDGVLPQSTSADWSDLQRKEYLAAREAGLSIFQAQLTVRLAEELRRSGLEALMGRLATVPHFPSRTTFKRRGKALKEEPDYKKKPKF